jgi:hypothetical protein
MNSSTRFGLFCALLFLATMWGCGKDKKSDDVATPASGGATSTTAAQDDDPEKIGIKPKVNIRKVQ